MALYIDGVSFAHNTNPCAQAKSAPTRTYRKNKEGLLIHCTAKAKKKRTGEGCHWCTSVSGKH